jgi:hypothetical protein
MKNWRNVVEHMMLCTACIFNYYLCDFLEIIDKKLDKNDKTDDNMYILHVKIYAIKNYIELGR